MSRALKKIKNTKKGFWTTNGLVFHKLEEKGAQCNVKMQTQDTLA